MDAPLFDQATGEPGRRDDQRAGEENDQPRPPTARQGGVPAAFRRRGDRPKAGGNADEARHRIVVEHPRVAEEAARVLPLPVAAGDGDVDRQIAGVEAGVAIELVEVDDRGDHAPETPTLVRSVDEDGQPGDEAAAALDEIDRTGEHDVAAVARAQRRLALVGVLGGSRGRSPFRCP